MGLCQSIRAATSSQALSVPSSNRPESAWRNLRRCFSLEGGASRAALALRARLCQKEPLPPGDTKTVTAIKAAFERIGEENAFAVLARAAELQRQGRDIINLGIGQPDFPTPPHIVEAAVKALRDGHHGYTPATGIAPLREAVAADLHQRFGVEGSPDLVLIAPGGKVTM